MRISDWSSDVCSSDLLFDLGEDGVEAAENGGAVLLGDDALVHQHGAVRLGPGAVLGVESTVEAAGGIDALHHRRRAAGEAPAPHGFGPRVRGRAVARFPFRLQLLRLGVPPPLRVLPAFMLAFVWVIRKTISSAGVFAQSSTATLR